MIPGGMGRLFKQAQDLQKKMERLEEDLKGRVVEGQSGGGAVTAFVNGQRDLVQIKIRPDAAQGPDLSLLEDLVVAAVSAAQAKAKELKDREMAKATGGLKMPGMS